MTRRMMLVVLALMGLMVLVVTVSPPDPGVDRRGRATVTPTPQQAQLSDPEAFDVSETLSAQSGTKPQTIEAELGDRVQIVVNGTEPDSVELGDYIIQELEKGVPARFELLAEVPGTYPLTLVNEGRRIGTLEIR